MTFKEFIKPAWRKVIVVIVIFFFWFGLVKSLEPVIECNCVVSKISLMPCQIHQDYSSYLIFDENGGCYCPCDYLPFENLFENYFWFGLIPLIIIYFLISLVFYLINQRIKRR